jgi:hypothetical protein
MHVILIICNTVYMHVYIDIDMDTYIFIYTHSHRQNHTSQLIAKTHVAILHPERITFDQSLTFYRCEALSNVIQQSYWGLHKEYKSPRLPPSVWRYWAYSRQTQKTHTHIPVNLHHPPSPSHPQSSNGDLKIFNRSYLKLVVSIFF